MKKFWHETNLSLGTDDPTGKLSAATRCYRFSSDNIVLDDPAGLTDNMPKRRDP